MFAWQEKGDGTGLHGMGHLLFILMEVSFSQQSNAGLYWQGICFTALSAPQKGDKEKLLDLDCRRIFFRADLGMEMVLGASWVKISRPFGCKLLPANNSCLCSDRRGEDVSLQQKLC